MPPEPAIEKSAEPTRSEAMSMSPAPPIEAEKLPPSTASIRMSPEPPIAAPASIGVVTSTVTGRRMPQEPNQRPSFILSRKNGETGEKVSDRVYLSWRRYLQQKKK